MLARLCGKLISIPVRCNACVSRHARILCWALEQRNSRADRFTSKASTESSLLPDTARDGAELSRAWQLTTVEGAGGAPPNVLEAGDPSGPEILFVHGKSQRSLASLSQLRSSLGARYRLVAFDLRGHGGSGRL